MPEQKYRNPIPTVDVIVHTETSVTNNGIVLIKRKNPPIGWALPGGYVNYGESLEDAAIREAKEEISITITKLSQFKAYSDPKRDPRQHNISFVFIVDSSYGKLKAADDAKELMVFDLEALYYVLKIKSIPRPIIFDGGPIVFDHPQIITDYYEWWKADKNKWRGVK